MGWYGRRLAPRPAALIRQQCAAAGQAPRWQPRQAAERGWLRRELHKMAATGAEAAAVAAEEEKKRLPEDDDPESGGDSEDEGDSDSSGDGEDEEKENEAEIQRLEEQVGPGGAVGRGRWGSAPGPAPGRGKRGWRPGPGLVAFPPR